MILLNLTCLDPVSAGDDTGDGKDWSTLTVEGIFSCELGGSIASLLGTGVVD